MPSVHNSPYFTISPAPHGGRGAFATCHIPKDTLVLSCSAPYAYVICRKFRKEVCAWCFAWSWEVAKKSSWSVTTQLQQETIDPERVNGNQNKGGGTNRNGVWFCGEECKGAWNADGEELGGLGHGGIRGIVNAALERCLSAMEKGKSKLHSRTKGNLGSSPGLKQQAFLQSLEDLAPGSISPTQMEEAWERAEQLSSDPSAPSFKGLEKRYRTSGNGKTGSSLSSPTELSELELDTARFVLSGLLRKCIEEYRLLGPQLAPKFTDTTHVAQAESAEGTPLDPSTAVSPENKHTSSETEGFWSDLLELQDNILSQIQSKPHVLASHIRIWAFAKYVVFSALRETKDCHDQTKALLGTLWISVNMSRDTRMILGREHGNVFGLWDAAPEGVENEMLGWGLYTFGSYFNHDCSPTLRKKRNGRVMEFYTVRDMVMGEELCIEYVDGGEQTQERREMLRNGWFFECGCVKCARELNGC